MTLVSSSTLLGAGFKHYENSLSRGAWDRNLYQKRVVDDTGTRYFLDIVEYDWIEYPHRADDHRYSYEATVHFYCQDGEPWARVVRAVQAVGGTDSIEFLEEFFENVWYRNKLGYYQN